MNHRGFTLLEALVATVIMGIAVTGVVNLLSASARNAAHLTQYDRATLLARQKMDELLIEPNLKRGMPMQGTWDPGLTGGIPTLWSARVDAFEARPALPPASGSWTACSSMSPGRTAPSAVPSHSKASADRSCRMETWSVSRPAKQRQSERGVTMIELIIAITLVAAISTGLLVAMRNSLAAYQKISDRLSENRRVMALEQTLNARSAE